MQSSACNFGVSFFLFVLENLEPNLLPTYNYPVNSERIYPFLLFYMDTLFSVASFYFMFKHHTVFSFGCFFPVTVEVIRNKWKFKLKNLRAILGYMGYTKDKPRSLTLRNLQFN